MVEEKKKSIFRKVIDEKDVNGNVKRQITIDVSPYDTSEMDGFKVGSKVYTGYTCQIKVSKFGNQPKVSYCNFNPLNVDIEEALKQMFVEVHKLLNKK